MSHYPMDFPHPTRHEVVAAIRAAFSGVDRENAISLHEGRVIDLHGSADERAGARSLDVELIWEQVPPKHIERFSSALSFLDPKGFRYYIPAYMIWTLDANARGGTSCHSTFFHLECLDERDRYNLHRLQLLNDDQRRSIALFLLYFSTDRYYGDDARKAVQRFWEHYLPEEYRR